MEFKKYQHLERYGTDEVDGIEMGTCYVFPKIDGTNASAWYDNGIQAGSRNRHLTLEKDNAGFFKWASENEKLKTFYADFQHLRLYGEWLVPHSFKQYRDDAWQNFYVFDVVNADGDYMHYNAYSEILSSYGIEHVPPIAIVERGDKETFSKLLDKNTYLVKDGQGVGEGIVIKNYNFVNRFGRIAWAKMVTNEFKEAHTKAMGAAVVLGKRTVEKAIAEQYVTSALVEKEYQKIALADGWNSRMIPRLLGTVHHAIITEETWHFVKKHKNPTVDFRALQKEIYNQVKVVKPELF